MMLRLVKLGWTVSDDEVPSYVITIVEGDLTSEGIERHANAAAARLSAIRSAVSILLDKRGAFRASVARCQVKSELNGKTERFEVHVAVDALPGG
jgi:hypothetical protein